MRALGGPCTSDGTIGIGNHIARIGFKVSMIDELSFVRIFQNYIRLGKPFSTSPLRIFKWVSTFPLATG